MTPTIEDVLKKHIDAEKEKHSGIVFKHDETIYAAMTEYASLNRQGCEELEAVSMAQKIILDDYTEQIRQILKCLPKDFHKDISLPARIMNLWQYYEANENKVKSFTSELIEARKEIKNANEFIRDIAKLLGEDDLGLDGKTWSIDDFENVIKQLASLNRQGWTRVEDQILLDCIEAIGSRIDGEWENKSLIKVGNLHSSMRDDIAEIIKYYLTANATTK